jgi:hypothetical protein
MGTLTQQSASGVTTTSEWSTGLRRLVRSNPILGNGANLTIETAGQSSEPTLYYERYTDPSASFPTDGSLIGGWFVGSA